MDSSEEIVEAANRLLRAFPEHEHKDLSTNDFYYFSKSKLLEKEGKGPRTSYHSGSAERIVFVELLRRRYNLPLPAIKKALEFVEPETIARVARGEEELVLLGTPPRERAPARLSVSSPLEPIQESPAEYLRRARKDLNPELKRSETFQRIPLTKDIELNIRGSLTAEQLRQLAIIGELIKSIFAPGGRSS